MRKFTNAGLRRGNRGVKYCRGDAFGAGWKLLGQAATVIGRAAQMPARSTGSSTSKELFIYLDELKTFVKKRRAAQTQNFDRSIAASPVKIQIESDFGETARRKIPAFTVAEVKEIFLTVDGLL